jgi:hypothetical protein
MNKADLLFSITLIFLIIIFLIYRMISDIWTSKRKNEVLGFLENNTGQDIKVSKCMQNKIINKYTYREFKTFINGLSQVMLYISLPNYEPDELSKSFITDIVKFESECS